MSVALQASYFYQECQFQHLTSRKPKSPSPQMSVKTQTVTGSAVHVKGCLLLLFPAFLCVIQQEVQDIGRKGSLTQYLKMSLFTCLFSP